MNLNQMLMSTLMGQLRNNNPSAFNEVQSLMNSGKSPDQVLNELLQSGRFSQQDLMNAQNYLNSNLNNTNIRKF